MTETFFRSKRAWNRAAGFTLIEMLIVIVILGILAMIIIPQITVSTEDAKVSTLKSNLTTMRSAIEIYYAQHGNTYPGAIKTDGSGAVANAAEAVTAFTNQLTLYSDSTGKTSVDKTGLTGTVFGPYVKNGVLPKNPFTDTNDVTADIATIDITTKVADTGTKAWKFYVKTGILIANDSATHQVY
jgi:prepilin-type N-terminal cleavage/methylation domain-containing protein